MTHLLRSSSTRTAATLLVALGLCLACASKPVPMPILSKKNSTKGEPWDTAMKQLSSDLAERLRSDEDKPLRVAVLAFTTAEGGRCDAGASAAEDLTTRLFATKKFDVIERGHLQQVLKEQGAAGSDLMDPDSVAKLGRLVGANGVVIGTFSPVSTYYRVNARIVLVESASVASSAATNLRRSEAEQFGSCE